MQFEVGMKCPDALRYAVKAAVAHITDVDERNAAYEQAMEAAAKWFEWDEYICVLVDTDAQTCTVLQK